MKVEDVKRKYKDKWVLAEVLKEDRLNRVLEVKPLFISSNRDDVYKSLAKVKKGSHVATLFTGEVPPKGMTYTFYVCTSI